MASSPRRRSGGAAVTSGHESASPTSIRILELFFTIFESRRGVRLKTLRALPGYRGMDDEVFRVVFHRDLDQLADMGVRWSSHGEDGGTVYRIDATSVHQGGELLLTPEQLVLIHMGLAAVGPVDERLSTMLDMTLRARVDDVLAPTGHQLSAVVEDSPGGIDTILRGITERIPVSFAYTSATESTVRSVEPWRLLIRGHAMYVWGFDLDRQAPRMFRLSRIEGGIELVGEPGDADHAAPPGVDPFADYRVSPTLLVAEAAALPFWGELTAVDPPADSSSVSSVSSSVSSSVAVDVPRGWVVMRGRSGSLFEWRHRLIDHAHQCVVLEPASLRQEILRLLEAGARIGQGSAGARTGQGSGGHA